MYMRRNNKETIAVVLAIVCGVVIFMIGRWYWYQAEIVETIRAGQIIENQNGELEITVGE